MKLKRSTDFLIVEKKEVEEMEWHTEFTNVFDNENQLIANCCSNGVSVLY